MDGNNFSNNEKDIYSKVTDVQEEKRNVAGNKKINKPLIIGGAAGLVAIICIIVVIVNVVAVNSNPMVKILKATKKTIDKGSFEAKCSMVERRNGVIRDENELEGVFVLNDKELEFDFLIKENDYWETRYATYDGRIYIEKISDDYHYDSHSTKMDEDYVEFAVDVYELINFSSPSKTDFEELIDLLYDICDDDDVCDVLDDIEDEHIESFEKFLKAYQKKFGDKEWLEDCLNYEKDGNTYIFEPDWEKLGDDFIDTLEKYMEDTLRDFDIRIRDVERELEFDDDNELTIEITLEKGCIKKIVMEAEWDYYNVKYEEEIEIILSDVGSARINKLDIKEFVESIDEH